MLSKPSDDSRKAIGVVALTLPKVSRKIVWKTPAETCATADAVQPLLVLPNTVYAVVAVGLTDTIAEVGDPLRPGAGAHEYESAPVAVRFLAWPTQTPE